MRSTLMLLLVISALPGTDDHRGDLGCSADVGKD